MTVYTLFGQPALGLTVASDNTQYTMGMQFSLSQSAALTGIWWYSGTGAAVLPQQCGIYAVTGQRWWRRTRRRHGRALRRPGG